MPVIRVTSAPGAVFAATASSPAHRRPQQLLRLFEEVVNGRQTWRIDCQRDFAPPRSPDHVAERVRIRNRRMESSQTDE